MSRPLSLFLRFTAITLAGACVFALIAALLIPEVANVSGAGSYEKGTQIALPDLLQGSIITDMNGQPAGSLVGSENRVIVPLSQISTEMQQAVLAVEDSDFYVHHGVSAKSVLRAVRANSAAGGVSQGGSTITQ
ncbi:MAG: hypothetical protein F2518_08815, partial [Actinobacteria bacterium]|nr:hypothetical protein [Actinomycetota bacterium]